MSDFLLTYYWDYDFKKERPSPQQLQNSISAWRRWHDVLFVQNRKAKPIKLWARDGVNVDALEVNKPITIVVKESLGGVIFLQAANYGEAIEIASQCPILQLGGNIEIRKICILEGIV